MNPIYAFKSISVYPHHVKQNICGTRAKYRDGKKDTAVKVYTINQESVYLLISNVPAIGGAEELQALCEQYGIVEDFRPLDEYPCEDFTEVYLVKYSVFPAARTAKKQLDDRSFLGSSLHVCYAPEFETVSETRLKLQERRKYVAWKTNTGKNQTNTSYQHKSNVSSGQATRNQLPSTSSLQPVTYIWAGKEYTEYPKPPLEDLPVQQKKERITSSSFVPRQLQSSHSLTWNSAENNTSSQCGSSSASQNQLPHISDSSYQNTVSDVRKRVAQVAHFLMGMHFWRKHRQSLLLITVADSAILFTPTRQLLLIMRVHIIQKCYHSNVLAAPRFFARNTSCKVICTHTILLVISNAVFVVEHFVIVAAWLGTSAHIA